MSLRKWRSQRKKRELTAKLEQLEAEKTRLEELGGQIPGLQEAVDLGYEALQETLAGFLNQALNHFPEAPETLAGLEIYCKEAIVNADEIVRKSGDYKKATDTLINAKGYYDFIDTSSQDADLQEVYVTGAMPALLDNGIVPHFGVFQKLVGY